MIIPVPVKWGGGSGVNICLPAAGLPDHGVSGWWWAVYAAAEGENAHGGHGHLLPLTGTRW